MAGVEDIELEIIEEPIYASIDSLRSEHDNTQQPLNGERRAWRWYGWKEDIMDSILIIVVLGTMLWLAYHFEFLAAPARKKNSTQGSKY